LRDRASEVDNIGSMRVKAIIIVVLLFPGLAIAQGPGGAYSRLATQIWGTESSRSIVRSPDGAKAIVVDTLVVEGDRFPHGYEKIWRVGVKANGMEYKTSIGELVDSEVAWSPDSKAFFVTYSDGGNIGTFHVKVFYVGISGLKESEPIPNGRKLLVPKCFDPEYPNVGAIKWLKDSSRLLIAVEVPPHSSCASMGTFRAYEINVPDGTVLRQYGQLRAKALFASSLGKELVGADDDCVRNPQTCIPRGLNIGTGRPR